MADRRHPTPSPAAPWPMPSHGESPEEESPISGSTMDTSALASRELDDLLAEDRRHSDDVTQTLAGDELANLLARSRHRSLATIPDIHGEAFAKATAKKSSPELPPPEAAYPPAAEALEEAYLLEEEAAARPTPPTPAPSRPTPPTPVPSAPFAPAVQALAPLTPPAPAPPAPTPYTPAPSAAAPPAPAYAGQPAPASSSASPGAWAMGQPDVASGRAGLASIPDWGNASLRSNRRRQMALIGGGVVLLAVVLYFALSDASPEPAVTAPTATAAPAPPPPSPKTTAAVPSQAEIEAREALTKLRVGVDDCIRHGIGTLPGSSPPIPTSLKQAKAPGYTPTPQDWKTAVWSCARFRLPGPMRFQVQWQLVKPSVEGMGVVWIDENGDGTADRALGFRTTLKGKRDPVLGEIGPIDASQAVVAVP